MIIEDIVQVQCVQEQNSQPSWKRTQTKINHQVFRLHLKKDPAHEII
jgi:hypothetical protein